MLSWPASEAPSVPSVSSQDAPCPIKSNLPPCLLCLRSYPIFPHLSILWPPSGCFADFKDLPSPLSARLNTANASVWSTTSSQPPSSMKCLDCIQLTFDLSAGCSRESCGLCRIGCYTLLHGSGAHLLDGKSISLTDTGSRNPALCPHPASPSLPRLVTSWCWPSSLMSPAAAPASCLWFSQTPAVGPGQSQRPASQGQLQGMSGSHRQGTFGDEKEGRAERRSHQS